MYLTVADVGVSERVGCEDPAEGSDAHLILKGWVLRERAVQVPLYLLCCQVVSAHRLLNQVFIVSRVRGHFIYRSCGGGGVFKGLNQTFWHITTKTIVAVFETGLKHVKVLVNI